MTVDLTETQIMQVRQFVAQLGPSKSKENFFAGKCGEVAVHNCGYMTKMYRNFYGFDLYKSVLSDPLHADSGADLVLQSEEKPYVRLFAQVKTVVSSRGTNLILSKSLYDAKLDYYNEIPQDVFIVVRMLSTSTYDVLGFITKADAASHYVEDKPVKGCYCIDMKWLKPIEDLKLLLA